MGLKFDGVQLQSGVMKLALQDAVSLGVGWIQINKDGTMQHVSARQVQNHGDDAPAYLGQDAS